MSYFICMCKIIINIYICVYDIFLLILPTYILINKYKYNDYSIYEYLYIDKKIYKRIYNFKFICLNNNVINMEIDTNDIKDINLINHCCIINSNDDYVKDITLEIKKFIHLNNKIKWKCILEHLDITHYEHLYILINLNDEDLSEKRLNIKHLITNDEDLSI